MTTYHTLADANGALRVSLHAPNDRPDGTPAGSEAMCMIDDVQTVLVKPVAGRLNTPGGMPGEGESSVGTMLRAVREQACADATSWHLIAYARSEIVTGDRAGEVMVRDMYVARVELLPWQPQDARIAGRQIVPIDHLAEIMSAEWPGLDAFSVELVALAINGLGKL